MTGESPSGLDVYIERFAPETLGVTVFLDPAAQTPPRPVTIRLAGRRLGLAGSRPKAGDHFVHNEIVHGIVAGSGAVAITARIGGVNAGEWEVDAVMLCPRTDGSRTSRGREQARPASKPLPPAAWSWRSWTLSAGSPAPVSTCPLPFVRVPGVILGGWLVLVALGIIVALITQASVISARHLRIDHALGISLLAIAGGVVGAKAWFLVLHRGDRRREGWCIQGLVAGIVVVAPALLAVGHGSIGTYLDATAPGLMFGLALGRIGCFVGGCCHGRPTASRWGVWSSDRRVGIRRIPTQLLESALALTVGIAVLAVLSLHRPRDGALFAAALAAYTLGRQGILRLRAERRTSRFGGLVTAGGAALALLAAALFLVVGGS